jgi:hypothetical protein
MKSFLEFSDSGYRTTERKSAAPGKSMTPTPTEYFFFLALLNNDTKTRI